jgi:YidC/Oxa1 family membrane protein insertase
MDQRRQLLTFVLMLGIFLVWMNVAPHLLPQFFGPPQGAQPAVADKAGIADKAGEVNPVAPVAADPVPPGEQPRLEAPAEPLELKEFPERTILLGDGERDYLQQVELTSLGAAIRSQHLTEPQYQTLDRSGPVRVLGNDSATSLRTFTVESGAFDALLTRNRRTLATVHWEFIEEQSEKIADSNAWKTAVFRFTSSDNRWEAIKTYSLQPADAANSNYDPAGYLLHVSLVFRNLSDEAGTLRYTLQGPVGMPLENAENTQIFRKVEAGTLEDPSDPADVTLVSLSAKAAVDEINEAIAENAPGKRPTWRYPIKWAGVDMQFFAALVMPQGNQLGDQDKDGKPDAWFEEILPVVVEETTPIERSDVSLLFKSRELAVPAAGEVRHDFQIYLGPKRAQLLEPFLADSVMDTGWFGFVSKGMVWLLNIFHHSLLLPYWMAIILLTVIVRACMFPISKRQVASMQKMKEINPKLQELKARHADDKEALTRAQLELMRKHGYNPLSGCLPIFLQLPIFIGLYNGLNTAVDLRLAQFLWADSLATPDALFALPFRVPVLGWTEFNLLPLLTIVLFIVQNKLFTPPPTNEEQALQQKMMNVMMVVIGVMFYRVPAGLCVYFIASSLWGICERKLLDRHKRVLEARGVLTEPAKTVDSAPKPPREPGFIQKLLEAADQAKNQTNGKSRQGSPDRGDAKKSKPRR